MTPMQHDDQEPLTEPRCEALAAGRRKYRRIEPCPKCGCFVRYTLSAACVECVKKHSKDSYRANRRLLGIG